MEKNKQYYELASIKGRTHHYTDGIKQMVSHFIGVKNIADTDEYQDCDIYLGEILFRFPEPIDPKGRKFKDYDELYKTLAEGLNQLSEDKFKVLGQCLTYQDVFKDYDLEESVRLFYSL